MEVDTEKEEETEMEMEMGTEMEKDMGMEKETDTDTEAELGLGLEVGLGLETETEMGMEMDTEAELGLEVELGLETEKEMGMEMEVGLEKDMGMGMEEEKDMEMKFKELEKQLIGKWVIVRTYSAGVHYGRLEAKSDTEVILSDTRRMRVFINLDDGDGMSHIALTGIHPDSKISVAIPQILLQFIEIIPCSDTCVSTFDAQPYEIVDQ